MKCLKVHAEATETLCRQRTRLSAEDNIRVKDVIRRLNQTRHMSEAFAGIGEQPGVYLDGTARVQFSQRLKNTFFMGFKRLGCASFWLMHQQGAPRDIKMQIISSGRRGGVRRSAGRANDIFEGGREGKNTWLWGNQTDHDEPK